jgi:dynein intermediate chain 2
MALDACAPPQQKVLLGTEQGVPALVNVKSRRGGAHGSGVTLFDGGGRHHGAIVATQRHPSHDKFFLTVERERGGLLQQT